MPLFFLSFFLSFFLFFFFFFFFFAWHKDVAAVQVFLHEVPPDDTVIARDEWPVLPMALVESLEWLHLLHDSHLFRQLWAESGPADLPTLAICTATWHALHSGLDTGSITCAELDRLFACLAASEELSLLSQTGHRGTAAVPRIIKAAAPEWVSGRLAQLEAWAHLCAVRSNNAALAVVLQHLRQFLADPAATAATAAAISAIKASESMDWPAAKMAELQQLMAQAATVNQRLLRIPVEFSTLLTTGSELFEWLHTMASDQDFSASMEMAMNKSEMECPVEVQNTTKKIKIKKNERKKEYDRKIERANGKE
jgi:hypothetical protein